MNIPMQKLLMLAGLAASAGFFDFACPQTLTADLANTASYEDQIMDWRQQRLDRLLSEDGYLTQVGLEWLQEGENRLGSLAPGGPQDWGTLVVDGDELTYFPAEGAGILVDGKASTQVRMVADNQGEPTIARHGDLSFHVIFRQSYALRVKDVQSPDRVGFTAIDYYDIQPDWRIEGKFIRAEPGKTIEIANILGQVDPNPVYGTFEFERDGQVHSLIGLGDETSSSIWFLLADKTSGRETYGAGRFLYSDGLPEGDRLVVDFNKAYNPPCVFNDYSTCSLPPHQNRLKLAVTAGEKDYRH